MGFLEGQSRPNSTISNPSKKKKVIRVWARYWKYSVDNSK